VDWIFGSYLGYVFAEPIERLQKFTARTGMISFIKRESEDKSIHVYSSPKIQIM